MGKTRKTRIRELVRNFKENGMIGSVVAGRGSVC